MKIGLCKVSSSSLPQFCATMLEPAYRQLMKTTLLTKYLPWGLRWPRERKDLTIQAFWTPLREGLTYQILRSVFSCGLVGP